MLFATIGIPYLFAFLITRAGTRPMDLRDATTPADYGLEFEEVEFEASDGVPLRGWFLDGESQEASIAVCHGLFRSRKEVLDRAALFRKLGFDTLVFDLRRHGASGGDRTTLGYAERLDFEGAVAFLRRREPGAKVLVYGVSMGAVAAILAARDTPEIAAVIADSPFYDIEQTVVHHVRLIFGLPRFPFADALLFFLELRGGFDRQAFALEPAVRSMGKRPLLIVAGERDERMPPDLQRKLYEASASPASAFHVFPGAGHGAAYRTDPDSYRSVIFDFLRRLDLTISRAREPGAADERSSRGSP
ncbi:MAG TPA: alpha/beta fold hydrolase [Vicinamibacteria bacterium]|nr:alpha/beta fold hydrolase [Vicinamibacteria bacterium]